MSNPVVVGLDLSLTASGIAISTPTPVIGVVKTKHTGNDVTQRRLRLLDMRERLWLTIKGSCAWPDLIVIEGPSYNSASSSTWDRGGLWWLTVELLISCNLPVAVAPPACRAKYATGTGAASKGAVIDAVARRWPDLPTGGDDNAVDAAVLMAMGLDHLGHPLTAMLPKHRTALDKVAWPEVAA
jgi:hypothetical protein